MNKVIVIINVVALLWTSIITMIRQAETLFPESGAGKEKLAVIRAALEAAFATYQEIQLKFEEVWPTLNATITAIVAAFNARGIFKKS